MRTFSIIAVCVTNLLIGLRYVSVGGRLRIAGQSAGQRRSLLTNSNGSSVPVFVVSEGTSPNCSTVGMNAYGRLSDLSRTARIGRQNRAKEAFAA